MPAAGTEIPNLAATLACAIAASCSEKRCESSISVRAREIALLNNSTAFVRLPLKKMKNMKSLFSSTTGDLLAMIFEKF